MAIKIIRSAEQASRNKNTGKKNFGRRTGGCILSERKKFRKKKKFRQDEKIISEELKREIELMN